MNKPVWLNGPPNRLLMATDLSARCDRALDRTAQLARQWQAEILALNVLESSQSPDLALAWAYGKAPDNAAIARRQLQQDLAGADVSFNVKIATGDAAETIKKIATEHDCGLIVSGMARNETFGRFLPGSTVERLARSVSQPLLVVRNRPHGAYRHIVVASDFSESSRHALAAALRYFPEQRLSLYYAHKAPLSAAADASSAGGEGDAVPASVRNRIQQEYEAFLQACALGPNDRNRVALVAAQGALEIVLTHYVRQHDIDLVVMGTHGRSGLTNVLLGSAAAKLLDWLPCDTLIVRDPRALG